MDRERFDASGRECPGPGALTWRGRLREAEAIGVPLAAPVFAGQVPEGPVESQPPGRVRSVPARKGGRGACHRAGPVADMAGRKRPARVRAGTHARRMSRGLSGSRPGQPGRRALKRGRRISRLRGLQGAACRMPDSIRRLPGRARSAPPRCGSGNDPASPDHFIPRGTARVRPSGLPACRAKVPALER